MQTADAVRKSPALAVQVLGSGRLAARIASRLQREPELSVHARAWDQQFSVGGATVAILRLEQLSELTVQLSSLERTLFVATFRRFVYVGPFRRGKSPGCVACVLSRVAGSAYGPSVDANGDLPRNAATGEAALDPLTLTTLAELVSSEIAGRGKLALAGEHPGVYVVDSVTSEVGLERLIPDSNCPMCGPPCRPQIADWSEPANRLECESSSLRALDAPQIMGGIQGEYLNPHIGLVRDVSIDLQSPYAACYLELPLKGKRSEPCIGRSTSYARAQSVALLEALERYCGWQRGGPRDLIRASYAEVEDRALDPSTLGLHPQESYELPNFPFVAPDPKLPIDWVYGYSFRRRAPLLVPAHYAFYGHVKPPRHVYEVSNGCALGASVAEAALHGLLEVVERDSFLLTWYRKLSLPEIATESIPDLGVRALLRRAELTTNSRIRLFLSTREHGIPSLFAVASCERAGEPRTLCAAAAHPNLCKAASGVIYELAGLSLRMQTILAQRRADAEAMRLDARQVRKMEDHALVNCLPETRQRFAFLLDQCNSPLSFESAAADGPRLPERIAIADALEALVGQVLNVGLDVVVVDQTMSELRPAGLACAKVIVPGTLAMTFGHAHRRTCGLPRLIADYPNACATSAQAGLEPHPFP